MEVTIPQDLEAQLQQEVTRRGLRSTDELVRQILREFLDDRDRGQVRLESLRRIGEAVDRAGLYDQVYPPER